MFSKINHWDLDKIIDPLNKTLLELKTNNLKEYSFYLNGKNQHKKDCFFVNDYIFFKRVEGAIKDAEKSFNNLSSLVSSQDIIYSVIIKSTVEIYRNESFLLGKKRTELCYTSGINLKLLSIFITPKQRIFLEALDSVKDELMFGDSRKYIKEDLNYLLLSKTSFEETLEPKKYKEIGIFLKINGFTSSEISNKILAKYLF